jgi:Mitochondrial carrier protein
MAVDPPALPDVQTYSGVWQGLKHIFQTEGISGMMRGNLTNCIRIVPNQAVGLLPQYVVMQSAACWD